MEEMGFAGEVQLDEDFQSQRPSYENFSIQIRWALLVQCNTCVAAEIVCLCARMCSVRFKQDQRMRNLDKHSQSGGEKSVSTMLYLVALQVGVRAISDTNLPATHRTE